MDDLFPKTPPPRIPLEPPCRALSVTQTFQRAATLFRGSLEAYAGLGLLMVGLPTLLLTRLLPITFPLTPVMLGQFVFMLLCNLFLLALLIQDVMRTADGQSSVGLPTMIQEARPVLWRAFVVMMVQTVLVMAGLIALLIPGLILGTIFAVAVPIAVTEPSSTVPEALRTSARLTKGNRWSVFVVLLLMGTLSAVLNSVFTALGTSLLGPGLIVDLIVAFVGGVAAAFGAVVSAVLYHDLRIMQKLDA